MSLRNAFCHFRNNLYFYRYYVGFKDYERNSHSSSLVALKDVRQQQGAVDNNRSSLLLFVFSFFKLVFNIGLQDWSST